MTPAWPRNAFVYLLILVASIALFYSFLTPADSSREIAISRVAELVKEGKVERLAVANDGIITVTVREDGRAVKYSSRKEPNIGIGETLISLGVTPGQVETVGELVAVRPSVWENWGIVLIQVVPLVLIGLFLVFMLRQAQSGNNQALSFGKSRARMFTGDRPSSTFDDVAGAEEAKQELEEVVEFLKEPERFTALGARIPKGVLLVGPPGTGKTLLARAVAGEAGVPFFSISGSEFVEMFVGVGASRVRDLFDQAKRNSPCIVFVDEIDAVGRHRGAGLGGSHDEREQTLNQILVEMDGFDTSDQVIIIASTNRPDVLDPALLRPGRFDRRVVVDLPDMKGREAILKVHARKLKMSENVDLAEVARMTVSFSGADLENLLNEAALLAVMRRHDVVEHEDVEEAREKVLWGKERRSRKMEDDDRRITAFHEAGHAVVAWFTPHVDNPHKITIMPRGMSFLGATMKLPEKDKYIFTRGQIQGEIDVLYGGRAAEETFCSDVSVGAADDIKRATDLIRRMVTRWGMSDRLGPLTYTDEEENVFLGYEITRQHVNSENTNREIDAEIRRISSEAFSRARNLISEYAEDVKRLAALLLDKEVLNKEQITAILGEPPDKNGVLGGSPSLPADEQGDAPEAGAADG